MPTRMSRTDLLRLGPSGAKAHAALAREDAERRANLDAELDAGFEMRRRRARDTTAPQKRPWSNARRTVVDGITFPSRMEARVYQRLRADLRPGEVLYRQVRLPLLSLAPDARGRSLHLTVDFAIVAPGAMVPPERYCGWVLLDAAGAQQRWVLFVEAKGKRRSRDWSRGAAAWRATWGPLYEWDGTGVCPGGDR